MLFRSILLLLSASGAAVADTQHEAGAADLPQANERNSPEFHDLLNALPEDSIHSALNQNLDQYRKGVFDHDRKAMEKVHDANPTLATQLISAAALEALKLELMKRQTPSNTSATTTDTPTSEPPSSTEEPSSTLPSVEVPTEITTTDDSGSTVVTTSSIYVTPTASVEVPIVTTDDEGNTYTSSTYRPGVVLTQTDDSGETHTFITDIIPGGGISSKVVYVTTEPNGDVNTITTYEFVDGAATGADEGGPDATRTRPDPGVQTSAGTITSSPWLAEAVALLACAVVFTLFL